MAAITKDKKITLEIFEVHQRQLWQGKAGNMKAEKNDKGKRKLCQIWGGLV